MSRLALIAGRGRLPAALAAALAEKPLVCAMDGFLPDGLVPDQIFRVERLALFLRWLEDQGVTGVIFVGGVRRPRLDPALFDPATAQLLPRLLPALQGGDDAALRAVIALFEEAGFAVLGLADVAPELLAPQGTLGAHAPTDRHRADATRARAVLDALDEVDVGQGCIVQGGLCLAVESLYGTDAMIAYVGTNRVTQDMGRGGTFVKRAKAGQDLRADLPAVGPDTIEAMAEAGLDGLCLQAGRVVLIDRAALIAAADAAGIAIWAEP